MALTYSNIEQQNAVFTNEELLEFLRALPNVDYLMVCEEFHESGAKHHHAYVRFKSKPDIRSSRFFDYKGCHPNIQACKKVAAWKNYIKKDGNWLKYPSANVSIFDTCKDLTIQQWIEYCLREKIAYPYMEKIWDMCHRPQLNTITERPTHNYQCDALKTFTFQDWNLKSLVLYGESGCGKTNWSKWHMPLPSLFVTHLDVLRDYDPAFHQSIIFDDVSFLHMPRESQIHLVDTFDPRAIHCRYRVANIPAGVPKVFTANQRIFIDDPAINRRTFVVKINGFNY